MKRSLDEIGPRHNMLLLKALEIADASAQRLENLYRAYPCEALKETIDHLHQDDATFSRTEVDKSENKNTHFAPPNNQAFQPGANTIFVISLDK